MRARYKFLSHTADVEFMAYGSSLEVLFKNALLAMFDTAADMRRLPRQKSSPVKFIVKAKAARLDDLLWSALQGALSIASARGLFGYRVPSVTIRDAGSSYSIRAELLGKRATPELSKLDVKGVSKYELCVEKYGRGFRATAVLDV